MKTDNKLEEKLTNTFMFAPHEKDYLVSSYQKEFKN